MVDVTTAKLSSMHFHGWQLGLKTGLPLGRVYDMSSVHVAICIVKLWSSLNFQLKLMGLFFWR